MTACLGILPVIVVYAKQHFYIQHFYKPTFDIVVIIGQIHAFENAFRKQADVLDHLFGDVLFLQFCTQDYTFIGKTRELGLEVTFPLFPRYQGNLALQIEIQQPFLLVSAIRQLRVNLVYQLVSWRISLIPTDLVSPQTCFQHLRVG